MEDKPLDSNKLQGLCVCHAEQAKRNHVQMPPQTTIHVGTGKTTIAKEGGTLGAPHPRKFFIKFN